MTDKQTFKQSYHNASTWQDRALIINMFHKFMDSKLEKWNMRKTAEYFGISLGLVSEDMKLADNIDKVKECKTRKDALELIKNARPPI